MGVGGRNLHGLPSHGSWKIPLEASGHKGGGKNHLASFHFPDGTVTLTEASIKKRASSQGVKTN